MKLPKWFRRLTYKERKKKLILSIRERCPHKRVKYLGRKKWTRYSKLGRRPPIPSGLWSFDEYLSDHYKCNICGKRETRNDEHLFHTFHKLIGGSTWVRETTNIKTGEKTQFIE